MAREPGQSSAQTGASDAQVVDPPTEQPVKPQEWKQVDTLLRLLSYVLATTNPELRWKRFMSVVRAMLVSVIVMFGMLLTALAMSPADSLLAKAIYASLGVGAAATAASVRKALKIAKARAAGASGGRHGGDDD